MLLLGFDIVIVENIEWWVFFLKIEKYIIFIVEKFFEWYVIFV